MGFFNPFVQQLGQGTGAFDAMHGSRGSAQSMAMGMYGGMQHLSLGGGWNNPWLGQQAGMMGGMVHGQLYQNPWMMHGQGGERMGQTFSELARRGMNTGIQFGPSGVAANLQGWSGAMSAAQNAFGMMGNNNPGTGQMMDYLNAMTGGGMHTMSPGVVELMARRGMNIGSAAGMNPAQTLGAVGAGTQLAGMVGLDQTVGAQIGMSSMAFGQSFGRGAGFQGFGGLSKDMAVVQDMRLRAAAGKSPMANMMGSLIAMQQAGVIKEGSDLHSMAERVKAGDTTDFEGMMPGQFLSKLKAGGVAGATAMQFLNAKEANQEQIAQFGLQDKVRAMQGGEMGKIIERQLQSGMGGALGGVDNAQRRQIMQSASAQIHEQLKAISNDPAQRGLLTDPSRAAERNELIARNLHDINLDPDKKEALVAGSLRNLQNQVMRDPRLKGYGNLAGLLTLNRGDILGGGGAEVAAADQKAMIQKALAGVGMGGLLTRASDAVQAIGEGGNVPGALAAVFGGVQKMQDVPRAPDGQGGANNQGGLNVTGTLVIKGDGQGILENAQGVAAPR